MIEDYLAMAWTNLTHRRMRTYLTMIGIFIGIAAVVSLISLGQGLNAAINEQLSAVGGDKLIISPKTPLGAGTPGIQGSTSTELNATDLQTVRRVIGVKDATAEYFQPARIGFGREQIIYYVLGLPTDSSRQLLLDTAQVQVVQGRMLRKDEKYSAVVAADYLQKHVFEKPVQVGDSITLNDVKFRVVGVVKTGDASTGVDRVVFINYDTYQELFSNADSIQEIIVQVQKGADINQTDAAVERALRRSRGEKAGEETFDVQTPLQLVAAFSAIFNIVQAVLIGIAAISLLVGAVGIMNTMYTSVIERTKEIGIMKAVGAQNKDILLLFLMESGLLGLAGGAIGVAIGAAIAKGIQYVATIALGTTLVRAELPPWLLVGALGFSFAIGTLSGVLPAIQAARLHPVDAIRSK